MIQIETLDIHHLRQMNQLKSFLKESDLAFDEIDYAIVLKDNDRIVGSCCKYKNVLKMIAIHPKHQNQNYVATLVSEMQHVLFDQGYNHSFVFTPEKNKDIFTVLNYHEIISVCAVSLLEKGIQRIEQVIESIRDKYNSFSTNNGAVVINGNPFTLGHQYLIEYASQQVDRLFVFVVEEDVSFFDFDTRFKLIQQGTKSFHNVIVLPSTPYIISKATFPNYFFRNLNEFFNTYATLDVTLFATYFSKLNIKKRFVGQEPLDPMTNAYNQTMQEILPSFNMELIILPRKENDLGIISASKVRECLKNEDFETLKKYVPKSTFDELVNNPIYREKAKNYEQKH